MLRLAFLGLTMAAAVAAQSPLTTTFANNNGGSVGGGIYFDLNVISPITITGLDLNLTGTGSVEVYTLVGTRVGNQTNAGAWTLTASGAVTGAVAGVMSPVGIAPFPLAPGSYGVALKTIGVAHNYTNGNGANQNYSTTELALAAGEASNTCFVAPLFTPRVVNCRITYSNGGGGTVLATNTVLGTGCVRSFASMYENFATAAAFDLGGSALSFLPNGSGGYNVARIGAYLPVGSIATPVTLALTDDSETTQVFSVGSFPGWTAMTICSNGFISMATGNGVGFTPAVPTMLGNPQPAWYSWHDYNPSTVGSGQIKYEESGSAIVVTWDGVWDFGGTSASNASNMQMQFYPSGAVTIAWGTVSTLGNGELVGYSPGGASLDPGNTDISALGAGTIALGTTDILPLTLAATSRPITNTSWNLSVTNIPPTGVLGVDIFGLADPGINDLFFIGMPGCPLRSSLDALFTYLVGGATHSYSLGVPNNPSLLNAHVFTTSAVFQVPPVNAFGAITSNGIDGKIGDF